MVRTRAIRLFAGPTGPCKAHSERDQRGDQPPGAPHVLRSSVASAGRFFGATLMGPAAGSFFAGSFPLWAREIHWIASLYDRATSSWTSLVSLGKNWYSAAKPSCHGTSSLQGMNLEVPTVSHPMSQHKECYPNSTSSDCSEPKKTTKGLPLAVSSAYSSAETCHIDWIKMRHAERSGGGPRL